MCILLFYIKIKHDSLELYQTILVLLAPHPPPPFPSILTFPPSSSVGAPPDYFVVYFIFPVSCYSIPKQPPCNFGLFTLS